MDQNTHNQNHYVVRGSKLGQSQFYNSESPQEDLHKRNCSVDNQNRSGSQVSLVKKNQENVEAGGNVTGFLEMHYLKKSNSHHVLPGSVSPKKKYFDINKEGKGDFGIMNVSSNFGIEWN